MSPRQVDECSLWEIAAAAQAWGRANGAEEEIKPPSAERHDELMKKYA